MYGSLNMRYTIWRDDIGQVKWGQTLKGPTWRTVKGFEILLKGYI